jgi:hypothetical protein
VLRGIDVELVAVGEELTGEGVDLDDPLDLVAKKVDADGKLFVGRFRLSPRRRNLPRTRFVSFRSYCMSTRRRIIRERGTVSPLRKWRTKLWYSSGSPRP